MTTIDSTRRLAMTMLHVRDAAGTRERGCSPDTVEVVMRSTWIWGPAGVLVAGFAFVACNQLPTMSLASSTVATGDEVVVHFDRPISGKASNLYWMTLTPVATPEDSTTGKFVVDHGKTTVGIPTSGPGNFEVRLYDQYPSKEHHLIGRVPVSVTERTVGPSTRR